MKTRNTQSKYNITGGFIGAIGDNVKSNTIKCNNNSGNIFQDVARRYFKENKIIKKEE